MEPWMQIIMAGVMAALGNQALAAEPTYSCEPVDGGRSCNITAVVFIPDTPPVESLPIPLDTLTDDNRLQCTGGGGQDWDYTYRRMLSDGSTGVVDYTGPMGITCISAILPQSHRQYGVVWWMHNDTHTTHVYRVD